MPRCLACIGLFVFLPLLSQQRLLADEILFAFDQPNAAGQWQIVNDTVMGGRSFGQRQINAYRNLEFTGNLSLANNGGFSSIRTRKSGMKLDRNSVIVARVRGDGREYKFNVYTQSNMGGYSWRQSFRTVKDQWVDVEFPVSKFVATWRGRTFRDRVLDPGQIAGLGFLLGDKKPGGFKLEVESIKVRR